MNFAEILLKLFEGFGTTVLLFAVTLVFALPFGLLIAFGSMSKFKPLKYLIKGFIWIIRGTPLMLQILLISMIPFLVFGILNKDIAIFFGMSMSSVLFLFVAIAFIINYSCYFAEIYRGGIESISKGQTEAGLVLGMTKKQIFSKIILFQVIRRILAPMSNEIITLVKDTSLAQILGVIDLLVAANQIVNVTTSLLPLLYAGIFYLIFNGLLTILFSKLEKKMSFYKV